MDDTCFCGDKLNDKFTIKLNCGHSFHYECLQKAFSYDKLKNNICPMCRQPHGLLPIVNGLSKLIKDPL